MRLAFCLALLLGAFLPTAAHAQAVVPQEALPGVLVDADGDHAPDRIGETVRIAGRAVLDAGALGDPGTTALASGGRGIWIRSSTAGSVKAGDSLHVEGTLGINHGVATLDRAAVEIVEASRAHPRINPVITGDLEAYESRLVRAEGNVTSVSTTANGGQAMMLTLTDNTLVTVFASRSHPEGLDFDAYDVGDRLIVTGLAGQYDNAPPYNDAYQIYPRTVEDIARGGATSRMYQWLAAGAILLLIGAIAWATVLRREINNRVADLRRSESYHRALVRSASDAVFVYNLEGQGFEVNPAARAAFGLGPSDAIPSLLDVVDPDHRDRAQAHLDALRDKGSDRCDLALRARGTERDASGVARIYEFESHVLDVGSEQRVLSLARDVGARRAYEAELLQARREAEEMVRLKSAFLASMSHEIRTPLTAVIGFAEILHDEVGPEQKDLAEIIEQGGRRLLRTLNSVLDLARLDSGAEDLTPRPMDLVEHIRESVLLVRSLAEQKGLNLTFSSPVESLPAMADAGALDRIVTNLVGNAVKFTESGEIRVALDTSGEDAILTISDSGIGIDKAFLPDLFSEFRQESEGHGRSHEGTGLGLAITDRLVTMMNGTIQVESEKGVGTTFTICLPRVPADYASGDGAFTPEAARLMDGLRV